MEETHNFWIKKNETTRNCGGINKKISFQMQKPQCSRFKIATCEAIQRWKNATLHERTYSTTAKRHGWSYIWQRSSSHKVCMVSAWNFLCIFRIIFYCQKSIEKCYKWYCYRPQAYDVTWRHRPSVMTSRTFDTCISGSDKPILILFVANCSWILLDSLKAMKSILNMWSIFTNAVPVRSP